MRTIRILSAHKLLPSGYISLDQQDALHLVKVLKVRAGQLINIFNQADGEWTAKIEEANRREVKVQIKDFIGHNKTGSKIDLYFSPIKNPEASWIAKKATELGVRNIIPFQSERSVVTNVNIHKMEQAVKDGCQQSGRTDIPVVMEMIQLQKIDFSKYSNVIFCDEKGAGALPDHLNLVQNGSTAVIVGNEGGFSENEANFINSNQNVKPVSLPKVILRAETAVITAISIAQIKCGIWQDKKA